MANRFQAAVLSGLQQFGRVSIVPKALCGVLVIVYLLGFIPGVQDNLVVTPSYLAPPQVKLWTLVTATLFENSILFVLLDIIALVGFAVVLEPLWGVKEFMIFSGIVSVSSMLSVASICLTIYALSGVVFVLFINLHGFVGLVCGYLVAVKQAYPDSVPFPPPAPPTLRVKHLPLVVIFIAFLLAVFKVVFYAHSLLALSGTLTAWIYLRFYQRRDGSRGDMASTFSFATFFPELIQPPISALGDSVFRVLVVLKICSKIVRTYDVGAPSTIKISLPGTDPVDAERRKQRALRALDERLGKTGPAITWPTMDDNHSTTSPSSSLPHLPVRSPSDSPTEVKVETAPQPASTATDVTGSKSDNEKSDQS